MSAQVAVDPFLSAFGSHRRSLRRKAGLSQEEIAARAGIHMTYLILFSLQNGTNP